MLGNQLLLPKLSDCLFSVSAPRAIFEKLRNIGKDYESIPRVVMLSCGVVYGKL